MISSRIYGFLGLAALFLASCREIPEYPAAPAITLNAVNKTEIIFNGAPTDSITFILNFTDGDGDLGLGTSGEDTEPPFQRCLDPSEESGNCTALNPDYNNYRIKFLIKNDSGDFVPHPFNADSYSGRFPRLEPERDVEGPLDGSLTYFIRIEHVFFSNQEAKFQIQILDRSFNVSNVVETPVVILNEQ